MTFWDFFHTHPVHAWILIIIVVTTIQTVVREITRSSAVKEKLEQLEVLAAKIKGRVN